MPAEIKKEIELEIAHVLFIDIVGYSKLLIDGSAIIRIHSTRLFGKLIRSMQRTLLVS